MKAKHSLCLLFLLIHSYLYAPPRVVATIGVGLNPAGLAVTPNNQFAYVANNNNNGVPGGDTVSVLNLQDNELIQTISDASFNEPYTVTINAAGTKAYVTNSGGSTVTVIDIATNMVQSTIAGFDGPSGFAINPTGNLAYVNNYGGPIAGSGNGTTIRVVDLIKNTIIGSPIFVSQAPAAVAVSPDGAFVYSVNYVDGNPGTGTVNVIRTSDNVVTATIRGFSGPFAIAITPDGTRAYVTNFGSNNFSPVGTTVSAIDLATNTVIANITLGTQCSGIGITPNGKYVYASNYNTLYLGPGFTDLTAGTGTVQIIDIATNTVVHPTIITGLSPDAIAISPNGKFAYVSNYTSNTVTVIYIFEQSWLKS